MKNVIIALFLILITSLSTAFILIPKQLEVSEVIILKANENVVFRYLSKQDNWAQWWPQEKGKKPVKIKNFTYDKFSYQLTKIFYHAITIDIINKNTVFKGKINIIPLRLDSIILRFESKHATGNNPLSRLLQYQRAKSLKYNVHVILDSFKSFVEDKDRVYAFNIRHTTLKDTFFVATKRVTTDSPSISSVYRLIKDLRIYIAQQGAKEVDFPILNITRLDSRHYKTMVAIPTDKRLNGDFYMYNLTYINSSVPAPSTV